MTREDPDRAAHLALLADPSRWPAYPFLPLIRPRPRGDADVGILVDALGAFGWPGFRATAFLDPLLDLPATPAGLRALPRETFDTLDELYAAGWRVDWAFTPPAR
jgi:hypothetical protein